MTKCYNQTCENLVDPDQTGTVFCCLECKAIYHNTTVSKLETAKPTAKRTLQEWISIFHERSKSAKIEEKSDVNEVADAIDFFSTPLGATYEGTEHNTDNRDKE